jgi:hypothetical protein
MNRYQDDLSAGHDELNIPISFCTLGRFSRSKYMIIKDDILRRSKEITLLIMRCRTPDLSSTFKSFPKLYELGFTHSGRNVETLGRNI